MIHQRKITRRHYGFAVAAWILFGCHPSSDPPPAALVANLQSCFGIGARVAHPGDANVRADLAENAAGLARLEQLASGVSITFSLRGASSSAGVAVEGAVVYAHGYEDATIIQQKSAHGLEDFVAFDGPPLHEELIYDIDVSRVAGLRLVANTLELLDPGGAPRLRVSPPWVLDAKRVRHDARLTLEGCAADTSPLPPWDHRPTPPGARMCTLHVSWSGVTYPALVDPSWTTTTALTPNRSGYSITALTNGRALLAGGSEGTTTLATTLLYDPTTQTFAASGSMAGVRSGQSAVRLDSGKVLLMGGSDLSAETYDPTTGSFEPKIAMPAGLASGLGTLLTNGKALFVNVSAPFLFDPSTSTFTRTAGQLVSQDSLAKVERIPGAKAVVTHGPDVLAFELYDATTDSFSTMAARAPMPARTKGRSTRRSSPPRRGA